jgi:hypothetical protein
MNTAAYHANMSSKRFVRLVKQMKKCYARNADMYRAEFSLPSPVSPKAPTGHQRLLPVPAAHVPAVQQQPVATATNQNTICLNTSRFRYPFSPEQDERYHPKNQGL